MKLGIPACFADPLLMETGQTSNLCLSQKSLSQSYSSGELFIRLISAAIVAATWTTLANPFRLSPIYMTSEHLTICVSTREASFEGTFTFECSKKNTDSYDRRVLIIPIWLPEAGPNNPLKKLLKKQTSADSKRLAKALGVKVSVAGKEQKPRGVSLPPLLLRSGAEVGLQAVGLNFWLTPDAAQEGAVVSIKYRQPCSRSNDGGQFYNVPMFPGLPAGISTSDTNRYAVILKARRGCTLTVTNLGQCHTLRQEEAAVLSPRDMQPIQAVAHSVSNKAVQRPGSSRYVCEKNPQKVAARSGR